VEEEDDDEEVVVVNCVHFSFWTFLIRLCLRRFLNEINKRAKWQIQTMQPKTIPASCKLPTEYKTG
jgi:hypothetical protein